MELAITAKLCSRNVHNCALYPGNVGGASLNCIKEGPLQLTVLNPNRSQQTVTKSKKSVATYTASKIVYNAKRRLLRIHRVDSGTSHPRVLEQRASLRRKQPQHAIQLQPADGRARGRRERSSELPRHSLPVVYPVGPALRDQRGVRIRGWRASNQVVAGERTVEVSAAV